MTPNALLNSFLPESEKCGNEKVKLFCVVCSTSYMHSQAHRHTHWCTVYIAIHFHTSIYSIISVFSVSLEMSLIQLAINN